jgi:hypothetical protein
MNKLISLQEAADLIRRDVPLCLAGPEHALAQLPPGRWIGGTIPDFMVDRGGVVVTDGQVFATDLSEIGEVELRSAARTGSRPRGTPARTARPCPDRRAGARR